MLYIIKYMGTVSFIKLKKLCPLQIYDSEL